ncbi:prostaglandin E2 receptor EP4 subtype-like [Sphaeramia orbicularis]|uniref:prostaglandin E2 receptor EP4 subtype-like n=1 Tax=Sphaeramia orbicularis TaxID=375764 RepID=UPI00117FEBF1|nr:prostaglandin E2 receptor EP4 subtype-like [Sphaeramia orbicularis]
MERKPKRKKEPLFFLFVYRIHPIHPARLSILKPDTPRCSHLCVTAPVVNRMWILGKQRMRLPEKVPELTPYLLLMGINEEVQSQMSGRQKEPSLTNSSAWMYATMENPNFTHDPAHINETVVQRSTAQPVNSAITLPIFMFAGGAIGNLIAIIVLSVSRHRQKSSAFYTLVCGLAVTDLLGTCLASPITIANYLDQDVLTDRHLCEFMSFVLLFFSLTGLSIICAMAAERYWAICCPYTYQSWGVDRRFAHRFLLVIYISHIFFCCLPMMGMAQSELQKSQTWCFISWGAAYSVLYGAVSLALILGTILLNLAVCGALLLMRQRTAQRPATRASVRERWRALSSAAETQMIAVLVMTSAVVLACSAPLVVRVFANHYVPKTDPDADRAAILIASVNPILDPWIYILLRRSLFRRLRTLSRRGSSARSASHPSPERNLFYPDIMRDSHVITQLMCSANVITQLPTTVKFTSYDAENLQQT